MPNVETFGFRGEALSSLCALSNLSVTTCEQGQPVGWKLEYDSHGRLCKQSQYSRQVSTAGIHSLFQHIICQCLQPARHNCHALQLVPLLTCTSQGVHQESKTGVQQNAYCSYRVLPYFKRH